MLPQSSFGGPPAGNLSSELRRLFLELGPEETRRYRVSELLQRSTANDCVECLNLILDRLVNFPSAQGLGIHALYELLRLHRELLVKHLTSSRIYDLFNPNADERLPAIFLRDFLSCKESLGMSAADEGHRLQRLLLRRSKQNDLKRVPATKLRAGLSRIWLDVPSTRPDRGLMAGCCARWIADPNVLQEDKLACITLMRLERDRRGTEGDAWTVSVLLEQVCRDPTGHSPDLQHLLWPLGNSLSPSLLKPLLKSLAQEQGRLVTLWVCLCLWVPQTQPPDASPIPMWPQPPVHMLIRALLGAFAQLPNSGSLCCTCLLTLAAIAASGLSELAATAWDLLLALHRDGPLVPTNTWMTLLHMADGGRCPAAMELANRIRRDSGAPPASGGPMGGPPIGGALGGPLGTAMGMQPMADPFMGAAYMSAPCPTAPCYASANPAVNGCAYATAHPLPQVPEPAANGFYSIPNLPAVADFSTAPPAINKGFKESADGVAIKYEPPHVGLQNTNNTCYMNSFIQSLFMTNRFIWRIFAFELHLKKNPSVVDKEDHEIGVKMVDMLKKQVAKMAMTHHKHTDIWELLQVFPELYRSGEQQDVTETIRFVFAMLGGYEQPLIREVFAGELSEKTMCQVCGSTKSRPETFSDLVLPVPKESEVKKLGYIPTTQALLDERLKFEYLDEDNKIFCDACQQKQRVAKWCEIVSPPAHLCICLSRFAYDPEQGGVGKEKTPVQVDGTLQIGPFTYELYHVILHTGKTATSGHYYAIGRRSEATPDKPNVWVTMDDSQVKEADLTLLSGQFSEKKSDDNPYVLFYRCQQAPMTPPTKVPKKLYKTVADEEAKRQDS